MSDAGGVSSTKRSVPAPLALFSFVWYDMIETTVSHDPKSTESFGLGIKGDT